MGSCTAVYMAARHVCYTVNSTVDDHRYHKQPVMCATHVLCKSLVCTLHTLLEPQPSPAVPSIWLSAKKGRKLALTAAKYSAMQFSLHLFAAQLSLQ